LIAAFEATTMPIDHCGFIYESGDCEVDLGRRELRARGIPVPLGSRAFDIVDTLVRSAGQLVTKDELMFRVWAGTIVEENTLQVHISAVRRALGAYRGMLKTESGRGYRLLGDWAARQDSAAPTPTTLAPTILAPVIPVRATPQSEAVRSNLPLSAGDLIGRTAAAQRLSDLLSAYRVVTLTGPGGIGKTALALEVARDLLPRFDDGGWFVELAPVSDCALVPSAIAAVLRLSNAADAISAETVARGVADKNLLLILDNCEHLIDAVAQMTETIMRLCPHVTVLSTSREVLRIDGEFVYRVPPLDVPAPDQVEPDGLLNHSAVELFVAKIRALDASLAPRGDALVAAGAISRHLDGIPLAIEFAASRAATLGVQYVAQGLRDRFALLTGGRRTALPRHQTLRAAVDWSYDLLTEAEQFLLRRLGVFAGGFTLEAAAAIAADMPSSADDLGDTIANLVAKSLVVFDASVRPSRWRLLETIRAYALARLTENGELAAAARRHAQYQLDLMQRAETEWETQPTDSWLASYAPELDDLRVALNWAYSPAGDTIVGVSLATAAIPLWCQMSLIGECRAQAERALIALPEAGIVDDRRKMKLYAAVAPSQMYTAKVARDTTSAWKTALALAENLGDTEYQLRALWGLWGTSLNRGEFREALEYGK
jgi:predicted ATPase/DNA-binding winged helix-turn-helix (wHTH) protein